MSTPEESFDLDSWMADDSIDTPLNLSPLKIDGLLAASDAGGFQGRAFALKLDNDVEEGGSGSSDQRAATPEIVVVEAAAAATVVGDVAGARRESLGLGLGDDFGDDDDDGLDYGLPSHSLPLSNHEQLPMFSLANANANANSNVRSLAHTPTQLLGLVDDAAHIDPPSNLALAQTLTPPSTSPSNPISMSPSISMSARLPRLASRSASELHVLVPPSTSLGNPTKEPAVDPTVVLAPKPRVMSKSASSAALVHSPTNSSRPPETEDGGPIMRDKYGFKRSFQYISRQDYEAFDRYYAQITTRRAAKWDSLLKKHGGVLPPRTDKLKRYIRKGIPHHLREASWFHYSGAEKYLKNNPGLFSMLSFRETQDRNMGYTKEQHKVLEFIDILERDLHRTFPENILFNPKKPSDPSSDKPTSPTTPNSQTPLPQTQHLQSLRKILVAFAYYSWPHPDESRNPPKQCSYRIGYCQSLNFVAGLILLVFLPNPLLPAADQQTDPSSLLSKPPKPSFFGSGALRSRGDKNATASNSPPPTQTETEKAEERAFWMLVAVVERLLPPEMYGASLEGAQIAQEVLWKWLLGERGGKFGVGKMAKWVDSMESGDTESHHTGKHQFGVGMRRSRSGKNRGGGSGGGGGGSGMPPLSLVTTSWFMTVFINVLPIETVLRVWDCFIYQGEKVLMRVTLTLLKIHEDEVLACNDTTDAWRLIKEIPPRMIDAHKLMDICYKPRVNLNPFDGSSDGGHRSSTNGSSSSSLALSNVSIRSADSDDDDRHSAFSVGRAVSGGGGSTHGPLMIQNDPLRKFSEKLSKGGAGAGAGAGGKVPRRGVGSVSTKMIEHYRALALAERRQAKK
ncbi:hypothetical protein HDU79_003122 [Rhizoclosmatium sp. JEL0117]|nr:hypothetical protein HDU79_003122 [Rhizoclosmatium sp. JEL0117]